MQFNPTPCIRCGAPIVLARRKGRLQEMQLDPHGHWKINVAGALYRVKLGTGEYRPHHCPKPQAKPGLRPTQGFRLDG